MSQPRLTWSGPRPTSQIPMQETQSHGRKPAMIIPLWPRNPYLREFPLRRIRATKAVGFILLLACLSAAFAQQNAPPELKTLFTQQAPIYVTTDQLSRLELPTEVLAECRPDLSDLRVFDAAGQEVAFLVDSGIPPDAQAVIQRTIQLAIDDVNRDESRSQTSPRSYRETYELIVPEDANTASWDLILSTTTRNFVRRINISGRTQAGAAQSLIEDGSVFRLTNPSREKMRLPLGRIQANRLIVTIDGEDGSYLSPSFSLESSRSFAGRERAVVELDMVSRREVDRTTVMELRRPVGLAVDSLLLSTDSPSFSRRVEVWDEGPGGSDAVLAREEIYRVPASPTVEDLEISLKPAWGDRLRVVIQNGDSPKLVNVAFRAVVQRPALVFPLSPAEGGQPSGTLRFGGSRAFRPQYDLGRVAEALRLPSSGKQAELAEQLFNLPTARLGETEPNPEFNPAPILAFAMRPGAKIDTRLYSHRRAMTATSSPEGLLRLELGLQDLARALPNLADIRIVDTDDKQRAYLLERDAAHLVNQLQVVERESKDSATEYTLGLPTSPVTLDQLVLETDVPFFDRSYHVIAVVGDSESTVAQGRMARRVGDPRPVRIPLRAYRVEELKLVVEDGDDAPLEFQRVEGRFPIPAIYFAAPEGSYSLLLGNPEAEAPRYEIARIRNVVLAVESVDVTAEQVAQNPSYSAGARLVTESGIQQTLLWIVLLIAVVFLGLLTLRLVRQDNQTPDDVPPPATLLRKRLPSKTSKMCMSQSG